MYTISYSGQASGRLLERLDSLTTEGLADLAKKDEKLWLNLVKSAGETPLGTGDRARRLAKIHPQSAKMMDNLRKRRCEQALLKDGKYRGKRFFKVPPFPLKAPIWKPRPKRVSAEPNTLHKLKKGSLAIHPGFEELVKNDNLPRYHFESIYRHGELGECERLYYVVLCDHARERGPTSHGKYEFFSNELAKTLACANDDSFRRSLARSLYRLAGVAIILREGDSLYEKWQTDSWFLLPHVSAAKIWKESYIRYSLPPAIVSSLEENTLTTVDLLALDTLPSPTAKSLHILLYDIAQWYEGNSITFTLHDMAKLLGLKVARTKAKEKEYHHWARLRRCVQEAMRWVSRYGGFVHDWAMEGQGEEISFTVWFAAQRLHLPKYLD